MAAAVPVFLTHVADDVRHAGESVKCLKVYSGVIFCQCRLCAEQSRL